MIKLCITDWKLNPGTRSPCSYSSNCENIYSVLVHLFKSLGFFAFKQSKLEIPIRNKSRPRYAR